MLDLRPQKRALSRRFWALREQVEAIAQPLGSDERTFGETALGAGVHGSIPREVGRLGRSIPADGRL